MSFSKWIKFFVSTLFLLFIYSFLFRNEDKILLSQADLSGIENFDLILSSGQSVASKLLNCFDVRDVNISHIGIVLKENDEIFILHATPDGTPQNGIRYDLLQTFVDLSNVNYYKIVRFKHLEDLERQKIGALVARYKKMEIPFDYKFDNWNKSELYCSELVYDIYSSTNVLRTKLNLNEVLHPKIYSNLQETFCVKEQFNIK